MANGMCTMYTFFELMHLSCPYPFVLEDYTRKGHFNMLHCYTCECM